MELQGHIKIAGQAGGSGAGQIAGRAGNTRECPQRTAPAGQARVQALQPERAGESGRQQIAGVLDSDPKAVQCFASALVEPLST